VDGYLAKTGGTQVSANRVLLPGGAGDIVVAAPGQREAVDLAGPAATPDAHGCGYGYLRLYVDVDVDVDVNYKSTRLDYYDCGTYDLPGWQQPGSWVNNQTTGTVAHFTNQSGSWSWLTGKAFAEDPVPLPETCGSTQNGRGEG
jgi:hypothetical protein